MRRSGRLLVAMVLAVLSVGVGSAQACSVVVPTPPPTEAEIVEQADLAVYGRVMSIRELPDGQDDFEAKIRIQRVYRGKSGSALRVRYTTDGGRCGTTLTAGRNVGLLLERPGPPFLIGFMSRVSLDFLDRATDGRYHRPNRRR